MKGKENIFKNHHGKEGCVQGQVGWCPEQPDPVSDIPAHRRRVGTGVFEIPSHPNHSMIIWNILGTRTVR